MTFNKGDVIKQIIIEDDEAITYLWQVIHEYYDTEFIDSETGILSHCKVKCLYDSSDYHYPDRIFSHSFYNDDIIEKIELLELERLVLEI